MQVYFAHEQVGDGLVANSPLNFGIQQFSQTSRAETIVNHDSIEVDKAWVTSGEPRIVGAEIFGDATSKGRAESSDWCAASICGIADVLSIGNDQCVFCETHILVQFGAVYERDGRSVVIVHANDVVEIVGSHLANHGLEQSQVVDALAAQFVVVDFFPRQTSCLCERACLWLDRLCHEDSAQNTQR